MTEGKDNAHKPLMHLRVHSEQSFQDVHEDLSESSSACPRLSPALQNHA